MQATNTDLFRRYRVGANILALLICFIVVMDYSLKLQRGGGVDFVSFWAAAKLALTGNAAGAYDYHVLQPVQLSVAAFAGELPFPYPPIFLLLLAPFALLPYAVGMAAWTAATFAGYIASTRVLFPTSRWIAAAFPPLLANSFVGQNAFLTAAIYMLGLALLPRKPFMAGLVLGCLVIKPQLGLLLPLAFIAARQWRTIAGAAVTSVSALLAGVALYGLSTTTAWLDQMPYYVQLAQTGTVGWHKLASVNAALRHAGVDAAPAMAMHGLVAVIAAAAVWRTWSSNSSWGAKGAVLAAATMLVSPYVYLYDSLLLVVPFLWLAQTKSSPILVGTLWCVPAVILVVTVTAPHLPNIAPLVPVALLCLAWTVDRSRRSSDVGLTFGSFARYIGTQPAGRRHPSLESERA
jgi:hypothetical protein